jgi:hypothetical protein
VREAKNRRGGRLVGAPTDYPDERQPGARQPLALPVVAQEARRAERPDRDQKIPEEGRKARPGSNDAGGKFKRPPTGSRRDETAITPEREPLAGTKECA